MNADKIAAKVLKELGEKVTSLPVKERADYIECTVCMCIGLMRGGGGDEYVRGFLESAIADLDKPSQTFTKATIQ